MDVTDLAIALKQKKIKENVFIDVNTTLKLPYCNSQNRPVSRMISKMPLLLSFTTILVSSSEIEFEGRDMNR